jgi:hypothetical protein
MPRFKEMPMHPSQTLMFAQRGVLRRHYLQIAMCGHLPM